MYSKEFLEKSISFDKVFAFEYNILYSCKFKYVSYDGYYDHDKSKRIDDGGFDFNFRYENKYFLIQAKCYSKYTNFLYECYKDFVKDLKKQPREYIGIFLVGTYFKYSKLKKTNPLR